MGYYSKRFWDDESGIPRDGLVAEYLFNGNALDTSGNGNNGVAINATLTIDRKGNSNAAYFFNNINAYIVSSNLISSNDIKTISIWAITSINEGNNYLISYGIDLAAGNRLYLASSLVLNNIGIFDGTIKNISTSPSVNVWHHYTFLIDNISHTVKCYVDGIYNGVVTIVTLNSFNTYLNIGRNITSTQFFNGSLDDIRIYNRLLTQTEITALANE